MKRRSPTWFFFALLMVVFAASLLAPLAWNRTGHPPRGGMDLTDSPATLVDNSPRPRRLPPIEPVLEEPSPAVASFVGPTVQAAIEPIVRRTELPEQEIAFTPVPIESALTTSNEVAKPVGWIPLPESLLMQLDALTRYPQAASWATQTMEQVRQLVNCRDTDRTEITELLKSLHRQADLAEVLADRMASEPRQSDVRRAAFALSRRLAMWNGVHEMSQAAAVAQRDRAEDSLGDDNEEGRRFRRLANVFQRGEGRNHDRSRTEAANTRDSNPQATESSGPVLPRLSAVAEIGLTGPSPEARLVMGHLERYEQSRTASDAALAAAALRTMAMSHQRAVRQWALQVAEQYRFPNLRMVVTQQLADRMLPQPNVLESEVDDWIQGAQVYGQNTIFTTLKARLVPDRQRLHLLLVADGVVDSQTAAYAGPAVFQNQGETQFEAYRGIKISPDGLTQSEVVAEANATNQVVGVSTDYERVPLLAPIARSMALKRQSQQECAALMEVEEKVADEARRRFEAQLDPKVEAGVKAFQEKVWQPLVRLDLDPTAAEMFTTLDRMVTRMVVGNQEQLAAHTPRPRAPSDSLASMQIHESLLNNALEQLKLDGQTLTMTQLYRRISKELHGSEQSPPETLPTGIRVTFAPRDAVRVRFAGGQVELTLTLDQVKKGGDVWENLMVRAYYVPEGTGLDIRLVRTDYIELKGEDINAGSQIALRAAFSKLLSRSRTVALVPKQLAENKRLQDLEVTQYEINDGWIGVAIGPKIPGRTVAGQSVPRWRVLREENQMARRGK